MHDPQAILLSAVFLGAVFGIVFGIGGDAPSDHFTLILALAPPLSFALALFLIGLAPAETALLAFFAGQGTLVATLIGSDALHSRR